MNSPKMFRPVCVTHVDLESNNESKSKKLYNAPVCLNLKYDNFLCYSYFSGGALFLCPCSTWKVRVTNSHLTKAMIVELATEWDTVFNLLNLIMLQKHGWMAAWPSGRDSPGPHICTLFSASHSELQGETKILKLKNLRPKDYANYSCIASVRNVCGIPDRRISFRLTNKTGHIHRNTSYHVKTDRIEVYMRVIVIKRCFENLALSLFCAGVYHIGCLTYEKNAKMEACRSNSQL